MRLISMTKVFLPPHGLSSKHIVCMVQAQFQDINRLFFPTGIDTLQKVDDIHQAIFFVFSCISSIQL